MCRRDWQSLKADLSLGQKNRAQTDTGLIFPSFKSDFNCFSVDGKWRLTVRPIQKAVIRRQIVGLTACPDLRPINAEAPSGVVK